MGRFMFQADNGDIGSVKFEGGDGNKDILIPKEGGTLATEDFVTNSAEIITAGAGLQKSGTTLNFYPFGLTTASTELTTSDFVVVSDSTTPKKITIANFANELPLLGAGQTWQNVTASRSLGVTYTNTAGKPIEVNVHIDSDTFATYVITLEADNGGNNIYIPLARAEASGGEGIPLSGVVPPNSKYRVVQTIAGNAYIGFWSELK